MLENERVKALKMQDRSGLMWPLLSRAGDGIHALRNAKQALTAEPHQQFCN